MMRKEIRWIGYQSKNLDYSDLGIIKIVKNT